MFDRLTEVRAAMSSWAATDVTDASDVAAIAALEELIVLRRFLDASEAHLLVKMSTTEACDRRAGMRTSRWLARESGMRPSHARARVTVANRLASFETVDAAMSAGELEWDRVAVIAAACNERNEPVLSEIQDELVGLSEGATYARFRSDVERLARLADPDGPEPRDATDSRLTLSELPDGVRIRGDLFGDLAQQVRAGIEATADRLFHRHRQNREQIPELHLPARTRLQAEALAELCAGRAHPEVRLVIRHDGSDPGPPDVMTCDPIIRPLIVGRDGEILDVGRRQRLFTDAIRAALDVRDGGCVFPGCDAPHEHCDGHHIQHWRRGGPTSLTNGCLLCRHHHGVIHRLGWSLTWSHDHDLHGELVITTPDGQRLTTQRHGRARAPNPVAA